MSDEDCTVVPPGCKFSIMASPSGSNEAVEVAVFQDHRFAFFFWLKWKLQCGADTAAPALVTLDWHEDLLKPEGAEFGDLEALRTDTPSEVALFCWSKLSSNNDSHILAAAYLNFVGDIYVVRKQDQGTKDHPFKDRAGRTHHIRLFSSIAELLKALEDVQDQQVFFDIDLDYFTESPDPCGGGAEVSLVDDREIAKTLDPQGDLMSWVFPRMSGMTIATEPDFCGGVVNSEYLLAVLSDTLFHPQLLAQDAKWKHLNLAK
jgi:hypothetical protein